jgi:hypothetical protein
MATADRLHPPVWKMAKTDYMYENLQIRIIFNYFLSYIDHFSDFQTVIRLDSGMQL